MFKPVILHVFLCLWCLPGLAQDFFAKDFETPFVYSSELEAPFRDLITDEKEYLPRLRKQCGVKGDSVFVRGILQSVSLYNKEGQPTRKEYFVNYPGRMESKEDLRLVALETWNYNAKSTVLREYVRTKIRIDSSSQAVVDTAGHQLYGSDGKALWGFFDWGEGHKYIYENQYDKKGNRITTIVSRLDDSGRKDTTDLLNWIYDKNGQRIYERRQLNKRMGNPRVIETVYRYDSTGKLVEGTSSTNALPGSPTSIYNRKGKLKKAGYRPEDFGKLDDRWEVVHPDSVDYYVRWQYEKDHLVQIDGLSGPSRKFLYNNSGRLNATIEFDQYGSMKEAFQAISKDGMILIRKYMAVEQDTNLPVPFNALFPGLFQVWEDSFLVDSSGAELQLYHSRMQSGRRGQRSFWATDGQSYGMPVIQYPPTHWFEKWTISADGHFKYFQQTGLGKAESSPGYEIYTYDKKGLPIQIRRKSGYGYNPDLEWDETRKYVY